MQGACHWLRLYLRTNYGLLNGMRRLTCIRAVWPFAAAVFLPLGLSGQHTVDTRNWTAAEDHQNMMKQLGITALRPGPSGNEKAPNHANYDEALANPFPNLPDALTLKNGGKVTTRAAWWNQRRPEIVEDFEREVVGRIPADVPHVKWEVMKTVEASVGGRPVIGKQIIGHVDHSSYPDINVDIQMTVVVPAGAKKPVPLMIMFGGRTIPEIAFSGPAFPGRTAAAAPNADPPATEQLIADGWGFASLNPVSIQADNGAGLTKGIIGLANKGQPRKPDDWGALRAWGWGASRALDYLEADKAVNAKQVGIEGVSRYGKAALVTMAFDTRFAVVLIGSSGEGGAKLHRRNWGEAVEESDRFWRIPLDGRQFPEIRSVRGGLRQQDGRRSPGGRKRASCALRAPTNFRELWRPRKGRREMAGPSGQLHGRCRRGAGFPSARSAGSRRSGRLSDCKDAACQCRSAGWTTRLAPARWRTYRWSQLEVFHSLGG